MAKLMTLQDCIEILENEEDICFSDPAMEDPPTDEDFAIAETNRESVINYLKKLKNEGVK